MKRMSADDRNLIVLVILTIAIIIAAILNGCATVPTRPDERIFVGKLQNLYCVDSTDASKCQLWRSEQPSLDDLLALQQRFGKLGSVVKWNSAVEHRDVLPPGVESIEDPVLPAGPFALTDAGTCKRLHELVDDLDNAPKPTLGHCTLGDDRTSIIYGFWMLWTKSQTIHPSPQAVWRDMLAHGFHDKLYPMLTDAFADCSGYDPRKDNAL